MWFLLWLKEYPAAIGCEKVEVKGDEVIATLNEKEYHFKKHGTSNPRVGQITESRTTVIVPEIQIGTRKLLDVEFALVDNRKKSTKILLNRDILSKLAYMINPSKKQSLDDKNI